VLVVVGHLEEALMEAIIVEDRSMAAALSSDLSLLWHVWTPFLEWPIHPESSFRVDLPSILTPLRHALQFRIRRLEDVDRDSNSEGGSRTFPPPGHPEGT